MNMNQIDYFLTVAEEKNISSAARKLYISQPALSKQIKQLEEFVGTELFYRTINGVLLTAAGEQLKEDFSRIKSDIQLSMKNALEIGQGENQEIHVGCFDAVFVDDFMPDFIAYLKRKKPKAKIKIERDDDKTCIKKLLDYKIDIFFSFIGEGDEQLAFQKVLVRKAAVVFSQKLYEPGKKPETVQELFPYIFIMPSVHQKNEVAAMLKSLIGQEPRIEYVDNNLSLKTNIAMGLGFAVMAEEVADINEGFEKIPLPEAFHKHIYGIWKKDHPFMNEIMSQYSPGGDSAILR